jgi:hypothetical protein
VVPGAVFAAVLSFAGVTAPFFSCLAPTLFLGNIWVAAKAVPPPTNRTRQTVDMTLA